MQFKISSEIFQKFPQTRIGVLVVRELNNSNGEFAEVLENIHAISRAITQEFSIDNVSQVPFVARWREIYRAFGAKPSDYRSSIENLIRMTLKGRELGHINTLVDLYNLVSLRYKLPLGGEDIDHMVGDLQLTVATGDEPAVQLLGDQEAEKPFIGEVLYRDDEGVICRCWNWREGKRTMLTENTKNAVLVAEANCFEEYDTLDRALNELEELVGKYTDGKITRAILSVECPAVPL